MTFNVAVWWWLWHKSENSESSGQDPDGLDLISALIVIAAFVIFVAVARC